ncbi:MAG: DUF4236 domain-containing protein [Candidatus Kapabacteria bacterium]|nr:DUF4236 domain-containing protein [Candidatus Kapabacteria bacterium]
MRFRRKAKLFPGVYLNISKTGISTTVGVPGLSINFNKTGTYLNTGIPGTGIYDRKKIGNNKSESKNNQTFNFENPNESLQNEIIEDIKSAETEVITSEGLKELKKTLLECYQERNELKKEIENANSKFVTSSFLLTLSYILIIGFLVKWFKQNKNDKKEFLEDLKLQFENCFIDIDINVEEQVDKNYMDLLESYKLLITCSKIWDITSRVSIDSRTTRSSASTVVNRRLVKFGFSNFDIIKSKFDALHFENANGGDIFLYPAFVIIIDENKQFGLIDIREVECNLHSQRFLEELEVPSDATIIDTTWAKVNKTGGQDKRFKDNYQISICNYGKIELTSKTGLNETYSFSNYGKAEKFANALRDFKNKFK